MGDFPKEERANARRLALEAMDLGRDVLDHAIDLARVSMNPDEYGRMLIDIRNHVMRSVATVLAPTDPAARPDRVLCEKCHTHYTLGERHACVRAPLPPKTGG